jgi:ketosteroid isomerase-like protein
MSLFSRGKGLRGLGLASVVIGAVGVLVTATLALSAQVGPEAKKLAKLDDEWSAAAGKKDVDQVVSFYSEDAMVYPPGEPVAVGKEAAKKVWSFITDPSSTISWKTTHAEVVGDLGYTAGTYKDSFKGPDGKIVSETGKYLCVWKKQKDGKWKAIHDMWNANSK